MSRTQCYTVFQEEASTFQSRLAELQKRHSEKVQQLENTIAGLKKNLSVKAAEVICDVQRRMNNSS